VSSLWQAVPDLFEKQMSMNGQRSPSVTQCAGLVKEIVQATEEVIPVRSKICARLPMRDQAWMAVPVEPATSPR
jgi:hypothetical protein